MRSGFQSDLEFFEQNLQEASEEHLEPFRAILYLRRKHCFAKKNKIYVILLFDFVWTIFTFLSHVFISRFNTILVCSILKHMRRDLQILPELWE